MNKISRTRQTAKMMRQKAKYRRLGSPVEHVLDILIRLRHKLTGKADREKVDFVMECIVSNRLYHVQFSSKDASGISATEMWRNMYTAGAGAGAGAAQKQAPKRGEPAVGADVVIRTSGVEKYATAWVEKLLLGHEVARILAQSGSWEFDVWALNEQLGRNTMVSLVVHFVQKLGLDTRLCINMPNLERFLSKLQAGYKDVPFHNYVHACDVVHGTVFFITQEAVRSHISALDMYAMILGAAMHDHGHSGYNNAFYMAAKDELARAEAGETRHARHVRTAIRRERQASACGFF